MTIDFDKHQWNVDICHFPPMKPKLDVLPCEEGEPGFVRLVDSMGDDLSVVRSARVSYNADWRTDKAGDPLAKTSADTKLINYLWKHKHTSPFESVTFTFEVKAPIFVLRQWHRHRTWSYNEVSGRYTELDEGWYIPDIDTIGKQSKSNKQMRDMIDSLTDEETKAREEEIQWVQEHAHESYRLYKRLIERNWARESARGVLPLATYSRMFATVNLHNLFHFIKLRSHEHAQYEIRVYSDAMLEILKFLVPVCTQAFLDFP